MNLSKLTDNYTKNIQLSYDVGTYTTNRGKNGLVYYLYLKVLENLNYKNVNIYFDYSSSDRNKLSELYVQTDYEEYLSIKNVSYMDMYKNNVIFKFDKLYNLNGHMTSFDKLDVIFNNNFSYNRFKIHGYVSKDKQSYITELKGNDYSEILYSYSSMKRVLNKSKRLIIIDELQKT